MQVPVHCFELNNEVADNPLVPHRARRGEGGCQGEVFLPRRQDFKSSDNVSCLDALKQKHGAGLFDAATIIAGLPKPTGGCRTRFSANPLPIGATT